MNVSIGGNLVVDGRDVAGTLETFDSGGNLQVRLAGQGTALALTGGSIQGTIAVRDGELAGLRSEINQLASTLISEVNAVHSTGFGLDGTTGANFFTGSTAADIAVNSTSFQIPVSSKRRALLVNRVTTP